MSNLGTRVTRLEAVRQAHDRKPLCTILLPAKNDGTQEPGGWVEISASPLTTRQLSAEQARSDPRLADHFAGRQPSSASILGSPSLNGFSKTPIRCGAPTTHR
jgi:hypothetical protein